MVDYREIIRLGSDPNYSQRQIEAAVRSSHHTISDVLKKAKELGITWPLDESVTNAELKAMMFPEKHAPIAVYAEPDYPKMHIIILWLQRLEEKSVGRRLFCVKKMRKAWTTCHMDMKKSA